jgi:hypothetical protein
MTHVNAFSLFSKPIDPMTLLFIARLQLAAGSHGYSRSHRADSNSSLCTDKSAESDGYNDMVVSEGGIIHLITSKNHYQFDLAWMLQRADPPPC